MGFADYTLPPTLPLFWDPFSTHPAASIINLYNINQSLPWSNLWSSFLSHIPSLWLTLFEQFSCARPHSRYSPHSFNDANPLSMAFCAQHDIGSAYLRVYHSPASSIPYICTGSFIFLGTHQVHFCSKAFELAAPSTLKILVLDLCETVPFQNSTVQI